MHNGCNLKFSAHNYFSGCQLPLDLILDMLGLFPYPSSLTTFHQVRTQTDMGVFREPVCGKLCGGADGSLVV